MKGEIEDCMQSESDYEERRKDGYWVTQLNPEELRKNASRCKCGKSYMAYEQYMKHYRKEHAGY